MKTETAAIGIYHPDMILPYAVQVVDSLAPWLELPDRLTVLLVEQGVAILSTENGRMVLDAPGVLVNRPGSRTSVLQNPEKACGLCFHPAVINSRFSLAGNHDNGQEYSESDGFDLYMMVPFEHPEMPAVLTPGPSEVLQTRRKLKTMESLLSDQTDPFWPCKSRSSLIELLFLLRSLWEEQESVRLLPDGEDNSLALQVIYYLHSHYTQKITIELLCREFSTNRTTLARLFKEETGLSVIGYLQGIRLKIARKLLRSTSCTIEEISVRTGYRDITLFGRHFRNRYGSTPSAYRASVSGN